MVLYFRGQGLLRRTTLLHCKDYIRYYKKFCFALFLSIRLSLNVEVVHIKSLRYSACQMRTWLLMQEWYPINPLYDSNQTKLMINSNVNKISN